MNLVASSIDGFLAYWCGLNDVLGEIHSVYKNALNIRTSGGQLVSILSQDNPDGPNTMVTELPEGMDFITMGLRSGMPVRLMGREAQLGEGTLNVRTSKAEKWWPRLIDGLEHLDMSRLGKNLRTLKKELQDREFLEGLGPLLHCVDDLVGGRWDSIQLGEENVLIQRALPGIQDLMSGSLKRDQGSLQEGVQKLLGLGSGSTPSGDDLLLGYVGTLSVVSRRIGGPEVEGLLESIRSQLHTIRDQTAFVSGSLLGYACAGRISSSILDVIRSLLLDGTRSIRTSVKDLLGQGQSSGSEVLLGILLALSVLPQMDPG
jgi:hypothetical protein